jgi:hypothetical protein
VPHGVEGTAQALYATHGMAALCAAACGSP